MEENKMLELLEKIEKSTRRQTLLCTLLCICAVVTALCCIVTCVAVKQMMAPIGEVLPEILEAVPHITGAIVQMESILTNLEGATQQLANLDLVAMVADVDGLVVTAQQTLDATMKQLGSIDFDSLNKAIKDLAAVIEPLAKLSNVFR